MDTNLITRLRDGDDSCFEEIYEHYHFKVFSFAKKYTSQLADAQDVTQNVFIHLWRYRRKLNPAIDIESILFKTSKQEISKWYKKQSTLLSIEDAQLIKELDSQENQDELHDTSRLEHLEYLLKQIPERRRKIFMLHKFEDRSYKEIALEMDMSTSAVANQVSKTLLFLRENSIKHHEIYWMAIVVANNYLHASI